MSGRQVLVKWLVRRLRTAKVNKDSAPSSVKARFQRDIECYEALLAILAAEGPPRCKTCPHFRPAVVGVTYNAECAAIYMRPTVPADGSGYCHRHPDAPKEHAKAGGHAFQPMAMCEHANEAPRGGKCQCPVDCGCRESMCQPVKESHDAK